MSQNAERARAIALARKLMDQTTTRGRTEGEMNQAMDKLNAIQEAFNLTLDEIVLETLEYKKAFVVGTAPKGDPMDNVMWSIANFTQTKRWREPGKRKYFEGRNPWGYRCMKSTIIEPSKYWFFGLEQDVDMATFLYELIKNSMESSLEAYKKSEDYNNLTRRGAKRSAQYTFKHAFVSRISNRLYELAVEQERHMPKMEGTGNDLVLCKKKVREAKFDEIVGISLSNRRSYSTGGNSTNGYSAGSSAANNVNLSRPVSSGPAGGRLLLA
jgi:hypothetical protein